MGSKWDALKVWKEQTMTISVKVEEINAYEYLAFKKKIRFSGNSNHLCDFK